MMNDRPVRGLLHIARTAAVTCALLMSAGHAQAPLDIRVALVVGNSAYRHVPRLVNTTKDAAGVARTLKGLGFTIEQVDDGDLPQIREALARVQRTLEKKHGIGMLYYAGHGVQVDWHNYMLP